MFSELVVNILLDKVLQEAFEMVDDFVNILKFFGGILTLLYICSVKANREIQIIEISFCFVQLSG